MTFQELILCLETFWADKGCLIQQPYDLEVGPGHLTLPHFYGSWALNPGQRPMWNLHAGPQTEGMEKIPTGLAIITSIR